MQAPQGQGRRGEMSLQGRVLACARTALAQLCTAKSLRQSNVILELTLYQPGASFQLSFGEAMGAGEQTKEKVPGAYLSYNWTYKVAT